MPSQRPIEPAAPPSSQPLDSTIPSVQPPDVNSDRDAAADAPPEGENLRSKTPPLQIQEIETLEDDSKGG